MIDMETFAKLVNAGLITATHHHHVLSLHLLGHLKVACRCKRDKTLTKAFELDLTKAQKVSRIWLLRLGRKMAWRAESASALNKKSMATQVLDIADLLAMWKSLSKANVNLMQSDKFGASTVARLLFRP